MVNAGSGPQNGQGSVAERWRRTGERGWRVVFVASLIVLASCTDGDDSSDASDGRNGTTTTEASGEADGGTINDTVPTVEKPVLEPVAIGELGAFGDGVTTRVADAEAVEAEAFMPGEVSGPGLAITVEITNGSDAPINLDGTIVDLVGEGDAYATLITTREDTALSGDLAPGESSQGTYLFTMPVEDRAAVAVQVSYAAPEPTVIFTGSLSDA